VIGENAAILPFLADQRPGTTLFAPAGSVERAQIQAWIGYINSEIHGATQRVGNRPHLYSDDPAAHEGIRQAARRRLREAYQPIEDRLSEADGWCRIALPLPMPISASLPAMSRISARRWPIFRRLRHSLPDLRRGQP
jgi:glutathione S-transferase